MPNQDNIISKINLILLNRPKDLSDLHQIRYLYIMLGKLFSYDLSVIANDKLIKKDIDFDNISKYQTCYQISEIFNIALNDVNETARAVVKPRKNTHQTTRYEHVANEIEFTDSKTGWHYKLLLDLTLDLYRIQAGMQTKEFAFTTDETGTQDIIPLNICKEMDKELGFLPTGQYKDDEIAKIKSNIEEIDMPLKDKINYMWSKLSINFEGIHELKQYFENVLTKTLKNIEYQEYNLYYKENTMPQFSILFIIKERNSEDKIYLILDDKLGLIYTTKDNIQNMINNGWKSNNPTILNEFENKKISQIRK